MPTWLPMLLVALLALALMLVVSVGAFVWIILHALPRGGGWNALLARYRAGAPPAGSIRRGETIMVGAVRFRRVARVAAELQGLYLEVRSILLPLNGAVLIPWQDIRAVEPAFLYWGKAARLVVGEPVVARVTLPWRIFEMVRPYLPAGLRLPT